MDFETLYAQVAQRDQFRQFRQTYRAKQITIQSTQWTYYDLGQGATVILWLVGGLKRADVAYDMFPLLADQFRIIAPDYPAIASMDQLADGLAGILDAENIQTVCVLSGSFGGMLAQSFVRRHPTRCQKIVLSSTTAPDSNQAQSYHKMHNIVRWIPEFALRRIAERQFYSIIAPAPHEADFYRAYLKELFGQRLGKEDILSTYQAMIEFMNQPYHADDLQGWQGQMLIIDSADDATFTASGQSKLAMLYPQAHRHSFSNAGHSPSSTQRTAFFGMIRDFFKT